MKSDNRRSITTGRRHTTWAIDVISHG